MAKIISSKLPIRIGLIGCGAISDAYFANMAPYASYARIVACADLNPKQAAAKAEKHGVAKVCSVAELLDDDEVDLVLNLTIPQAHVEINFASLRAGKHVYCEKPFSLTTAEGRKVLEEARKLRLYVGCAPDTVLGGGIQTCRKLIADGEIGRPLAATANMVCHGHESWHPSPAFYYHKGGGPLFDMGPYYLTALVTMLGAVKRVAGFSLTGFRERVITSQPLQGKKIKVETPTHITGLLEFASGVQVTLTMSFDVWKHSLPLMEVYGTEGSLSCPDPNTFGGAVRVFRKGDEDWSDVPLAFEDKVGRGYGVAEMAVAITKERLHRASGELALHVVDIMESILRSGETGRAITLKTTCRQPAAIPAGLALGELK
ncbi:predicted dehydrogenase [Terrimicrobium sacchariphilum]|uniref:Predicted dehydrogenase n=1 Tax=Terrimicrobium sacchariphilum TaxID=690879 RepID=A0A146GAL6_TERSA|nr:Gfo/Idh/MocA family oxidoreductase [Terrimicrobium sacchariphilum]GAT34490.1 predicted dehydrogenase [Terrimicrobium sacchariphilum]